jgi:galactose mutarotase-like enzyme
MMNVIGFPHGFTTAKCIIPVLFILILNGLDLSAVENPTTNILIVHSYHPTFNWTQKVRRMYRFWVERRTEFSIEYIDIKQETKIPERIPQGIRKDFSFINIG